MVAVFIAVGHKCDCITKECAACDKVNGEIKHHLKAPVADNQFQICVGD